VGVKVGSGEYGPETSNILLPENQTGLLRKHCGLENVTKKKLWFKSRKTCHIIRT